MSEDYDSFGDENVYYCYFHPGVEAVATCINCGKAVCADCMVDVNGQIHCKECVAVGDIVGKSPPPVQSTAVPTNPLAIISLVVGILGLIGCICGGGIGLLLFGTPAAIIGWIARKQITEAGSAQKGMELATIGLVIGIAEVVLGVGLLIFAGSLIGLSFLSNSF